MATSDEITNPDPLRYEPVYNDDAFEIWCPNTGDLGPSTLAGPPDFCPHCGDINHVDQLSTPTLAADFRRSTAEMAATNQAGAGNTRPSTSTDDMEVMV